MNATAPITQDLLTIPRKDAGGGLPDIIGMTRDGLRSALIEDGVRSDWATLKVYSRSGSWATATWGMWSVRPTMSSWRLHSRHRRGWSWVAGSWRRCARMRGW